MDGAPYGAYRRLVGRHEVGEFELHVDRVPPDPFAGAARVRLVLDRSRAKLPASLVEAPARRIGVEDYLAREAARVLDELQSRGANAPPGSGRIFAEPCGPAMIERSQCRITPSSLELRLFADLPASGRRVLGVKAEELLASTLRRIGISTLPFSSRRIEEAGRWADAAEDHAVLQDELGRRGLVAFVADGSLLARAGGGDPGPRRDGRGIPFESPAALAVTVDLPRAGKVRGMGIPAGVTVIVGGGFHGKTTLLEAIAAGVRPHPPGDGRERVAALPAAVAVRAEDGRSVRRVDVSAFFSDLPSGERAADFSTDRASGSTSQAAAIAEALEAGARVLLIDEDTSATNFMIRDGRMQRLVPRPLETIVPFIDRVRELYERYGVSTILVTGGSGDYLGVADTVVLMSAYRAEDRTAEAREIAGATRSTRLLERFPPLAPPASREPRLERDVEARELRVGLRGPRGMRIGEETVDVGALSQVTETGEVRSLARLLREAASRMAAGKTLAALVAELDARLDDGGLDVLDPPVSHDLARPRRHEIAAAINRWRSLRVRRPDL